MIVFSKDGILLDGQHRLTAVIKTGVPIVTVVVRGVESIAQVTMDTGKKRSLAEYLKMMGYSDAVTIAAVGSSICRAEEYGIVGGINSATGYEQTLGHVLGWIVRNYEGRINRVMPYARSISKQYRGVTYRIPGVIFDRVFEAGANKDDVDCFVDELIERRVPRHSIFLLQKQLRKNADSRKGHLPQKTVAALMVKAWNAYITGEEIRQLKFTQGGAHPEEFPDVIAKI